MIYTTRKVMLQNFLFPLPYATWKIAILFCYILQATKCVKFTPTIAEPCQKDIDTAAYEGLLALYNSTGGESWSWKENTIAGIIPWNFTGVKNSKEGASRPCRDNWQGLVCYQDPDHVDLCYVSVIVLNNMNLQGTLPSQLANISGLNELYLDGNDIIGTIPPSLGTLEHLAYFLFAYNSITGSIPSELGLLSKCRYFEVSNNHMTGSIPSELFMMSSLTNLYLFGNHFSKDIPTTVGNMINLNELYLDENSLSGCIPTEIGLITNSTTLEIELSQNYFSCSIPTEIGKLTQTSSLYLFQSQLTGTIPTEIGLLSIATYISIDLNNLVGSIPTEIGNLHHLELIDIYANCLTGTLPSEIALIASLVTFGVDQNYLTGTIPSEYGAMRTISLFYINNNQLSGSFPLTSKGFRLVVEFEINSNLLTSTIPSLMTELYYIEYFSSSSNYFTGTLPNVMSEHIRLLQVNDNYFSGSLTDIFGVNDSYKALILVDFSDNGFTGSFPSSLFRLPHLKTLGGASNCFSGELLISCIENNQNNINDSSINSLVNQYLYPLEVIDLSGLSSGIGCRRYIIPQKLLPSSGYYPMQFMHGTIPSCIWTFQNLTALYLVGNGFTGSIQLPAVASSNGIDESILSLSLQLRNLSLASNELTGTIPNFIINHPNFQQLDLSSNRFTGRIEKNSFLNICTVSSQATLLNIAVNRLSGFYDLSIGNTNEIEKCPFSVITQNIFRGNMFTFSMSNMIPTEQVQAKSYYGSFTLNTAMLTAGVVSIILLAIGFLIHLEMIDWASQQFSMIRLWNVYWKVIVLPVEWKEPLLELIRLIRSLIMLVVVWLVIVLTAYLLLKSSFASYGTYWDQYNWIISAAYMHGIAPVVLLASLLLIGSLCAGKLAADLVRQFPLLPLSMRTSSMLSMSVSLSSSTKPSATASVDNSVDIEQRDNSSLVSSMFVISSAKEWIAFLESVGKISLIFIANAVVIGLVNTGYLIAVLGNNQYIQLIQISLSIFKLIWNSFFIINSLKWLRIERKPTFSMQPSIVSNSNNCLDMDKKPYAFDINPILFRYTLKLINFIIIPIIITSLVSDSCFLKLFQQEPAPTIYSPVCDGVYVLQNDSLVCPGSFDNLQDEILNPPFIYSYQCSSSLIANYVPVLLYSYTISGLLLPFAMLIIMAIRTSKTDSAKISQSQQQQSQELQPSDHELEYNHNQLSKSLTQQQQEPAVSARTLFSTKMDGNSADETTGAAPVTIVERLDLLLPYLMRSTEVYEQNLKRISEFNFQQQNRTVSSTSPLSFSTTPTPSVAFVQHQSPTNSDVAVANADNSPSSQCTITSTATPSFGQPSQQSSLLPFDVIIANQLLNATIFATFGLAFPYLGGFIVFSSVIELWMWLIALGRFHYFTLRASLQSPLCSWSQCSSSDNMCSSKGRTSSVDSDYVTVATLMDIEMKRVNTANSEVDSLSKREESLVTTLELMRAFQSIPHPINAKHVFIIVIVLFVFWGVVFFDMIADVYGAIPGLITLFSVMCCAPIIWALFIHLYLSNVSIGHLTTPNQQSRSTRQSAEVNSFSGRKSTIVIIDDRFSLTNHYAQSNPILSSLSCNSDFNSFGSNL